MANQVSTLSLVGVTHLFVVPSIRSSNYVKMLAEGFPALANSQPGDIQEASLPQLRHLVVVDNTKDVKQFQEELDGAKCAVDFREIMMWQDHSALDRRIGEISASLNKDDVINLQFTR